MCHWLSVCVNCVSDIALCYHIDRFINNTVTDGLRCPVYKQPVGSHRCEWRLAAASTHIYQASSTVITHSANDAPPQSVTLYLTLGSWHQSLLSHQTRSCFQVATTIRREASHSLPGSCFLRLGSFWDQLSPYLLLEPVEQT